MSQRRNIAMSIFIIQVAICVSMITNDVEHYFWEDGKEEI